MGVGAVADAVAVWPCTDEVLDVATVDGLDVLDLGFVVCIDVELSIEISGKFSLHYQQRTRPHTRAHLACV